MWSLLGRGLHFGTALHDDAEFHLSDRPPPGYPLEELLCYRLTAPDSLRLDRGLVLRHSSPREDVLSLLTPGVPQTVRDTRALLQAPRLLGPAALRVGEMSSPR